MWVVAKLTFDDESAPFWPMASLDEMHRAILANCFYESRFTITNNLVQ